MKTKELIFLVEEDPEAGYTARALGQSIFTQAEGFEELKKTSRTPWNVTLIQKKIYRKS